MRVRDAPGAQVEVFESAGVAREAAPFLDAVQPLKPADGEVLHQCDEERLHWSRSLGLRSSESSKLGSAPAFISAAMAFV